MTVTAAIPGGLLAVRPWRRRRRPGPARPGGQAPPPPRMSRRCSGIHPLAPEVLWPVRVQLRHPGPASRVGRWGRRGSCSLAAAAVPRVPVLVGLRPGRPRRSEVFGPAGVQLRHARSSLRCAAPRGMKGLTPGAQVAAGHRRLWARRGRRRRGPRRAGGKRRLQGRHLPHVVRRQRVVRQLRVALAPTLASHRPVRHRRHGREADEHARKGADHDGHHEAGFPLAEPRRLGGKAPLAVGGVGLR
mmetsp:Transcript_34703/g.87485  ORF Transcript_34703/g.87485 Transcript_34703/m.87485 type:complete len:245 (+) Transcript_34703:1221-1955(+)